MIEKWHKVCSIKLDNLTSTVVCHFFFTQGVGGTFAALASIFSLLGKLASVSNLTVYSEQYNTSFQH